MCNIFEVLWISDTHLQGKRLRCGVAALRALLKTTTQRLRTTFLTHAPSVQDFYMSRWSVKLWQKELLCLPKLPPRAASCSRLARLTAMIPAQVNIESGDQLLWERTWRLQVRLYCVTYSCKNLGYISIWEARWHPKSKCKFKVQFKVQGVLLMRASSPHIMAQS